MLAVMKKFSLPARAVEQAVVKNTLKVLEPESAVK